MKKLIIFLGATILCLCACNNVTAYDKEYERFKTICKDSAYKVVYDVETKVQYVMSTGLYNTGNFTLLVDAEGKPLLYEE